MRLTLPAEFPNDNPELWVWRTPLASAEVALPAARSEAPLASSLLPSPRESTIVLAGATGRDALADAEPSPLDELAGEEIVIEELDFDLSSVPLEGAVGVIAEGAPANVPEAAETSAPPAPESDAYDVLVRTLCDVTAGEGGDPESVRGLLEGMEAATAHAWRAVLRNETEDISSCGAALLDEWAADVVARALGAPQKAGSVRRSLRSRGVCAFGLIEAA